MNQLCRVCGEPAAGFHFGAFTCEGCKSFFGRTYNNLGSISECKNNGECVINKKNRTSCKACRLRKCLLVGMSKSGSRYGRRSNWFKLHCLMQEQRHHQEPPTPLQAPLPLPLEPAGPTGGAAKPPPWADASRLRHAADADNNNVLFADKREPPAPPRSLPQPAAFGPQDSAGAGAAAALWAARGALLAPHSHPFALPFLAPAFQQAPTAAAAAAAAAAFYHSPSPHRSLFLPFVQCLQPPRPAQQLQQQQQRHAAPQAMSSPSSCSSATPSPPPPDARLETPPGRQPAEALLSLGPVQEQPIDLSVRGGSRSASSSGSSSPASGGAPAARDRAAGGALSGGEDGGSKVADSEDGPADASASQTSAARTTPLDLTTRS